MDPGKAAARRTARWLGGGVALMVVGTFVAFLLARSCTPTPPPKLVISKETTWFTGPLGPDGGIDWAAALEAEARVEGLKDEENGAPLMLEAANGFVSLFAHASAQMRLTNSLDAKAFFASREALARGELDAQNVDFLLRWLDTYASSLEKSAAAAKRPAHFVTVESRPLSLHPTHDRIQSYHALVEAHRLRLAVRVARGDVEGALADAATACALLRRTGSPATFLEQMVALQSEVRTLEQLVRCVHDGAKLPADRVLETVEARPPRWNGDAALREALRAERLIATSQLDHARFADERELIPAGDPDVETLRAFRRTDPNPPYRYLQRLFDELEPRLLGGGRPARDRLDDFRAELERRIASSAGSQRPFLQALRNSLHGDDELALRFVDRVVLPPWQTMGPCVAQWLSLTAKRDALLAELAFLAGAPERRDSWLGEPVVVTRKADGSIEVGGVLIELARERGSKLNLGQWR